jgi:hypothetical protein
MLSSMSIVIARSAGFTGFNVMRPITSAFA